jgi:subtilisin family serine protease
MLRLPMPPAVRGTRSLALAGSLALFGALALSGAPAQAAPSDQIRSSQQWVLNMLDLPAAWQVSEGAGVTVAIIDSGVSPSVSDLAGSVTTGPDLTGLSTPPGNPDWGVHGTWMASIVAGHGHDGGGDGIIGVAPQARVLSIRVIPDKGDPGYHAYDSEKEARIQQSLATGIIDAAKDGARVISMSIGYSTPSSVVRAALQYAESRGVVLVASSGNSGQDDQARSSSLAPVSFPAEYPGVLSVAAVNSDGTVASFSSDNLSVQVAAPGVNVPAEGRDGAYWLVSGTSPACALVAGIAALIKSRYPGLSPEMVDDALTSTASGSGYNPKTGFGTVDAAAALRAAGQLAAARPGHSAETASGLFGGGPGAVPASPVAPRGAGQGILYGLLGLVALGLVIYGWRRLARGRAEPAIIPAGYPVPAGPGAYPGPTGHPSPGDPGRASYREPHGYPARPGPASPRPFPDWPGRYSDPPRPSWDSPGPYRETYPDGGQRAEGRRQQEASYYAAPVAYTEGEQSPGPARPLASRHPLDARQSPDGWRHQEPPGYPDRYPERSSPGRWPDGPHQ